MSDMNTNGMHCKPFFDLLEHWLAGELDAPQSALMQAHHDACEDCRLETRLARNITAIASSLPLAAPVAVNVPVASHRASRIEAPETLLGRLLAAWREPLVLVPAFALLLGLGLFLTVRQPAVHTTNPDLVVINGQEYTQEEVIQAAQELELALRYLDKYGSYPARVVTTELQQPYLPLPSRQGLRPVDDI